MQIFREFKIADYAPDNASAKYAIIDSKIAFTIIDDSITGSDNVDQAITCNVDAYVYVQVAGENNFTAASSSDARTARAMAFYDKDDDGIVDIILLL